MTKLKWLKVFSRSIWTLLSVFFAILMAVVVVGGSIAHDNSGALNGAMGLDPWHMYEREDTMDEEIDTEYYKSDYYNADGTLDHAAMRANSQKVALAAAVEGSVLLWNNNDALPLESGANVSLFGNSTIPAKDQWKRTGWIFNGDGSGMMWDNVTLMGNNLKDALSQQGININQTLYNHYGTVFGNAGRNISKTGNSKYRIRVGERPYSAVSAQVDSTIANFGDAAVMVISRYAGEYKDFVYGSEFVNSMDGTFQDPNNALSLSEQEADILENLKTLKAQGKVDKIILLFNASNAINFEGLKDDYDIDACVWMGLGGSASYMQVAEVLSGRGENVVSGRMPDILANNIRSAPAYENYGDFTFEGADGRLPDFTQQNSGYADNGSWNMKYAAYQEGIYLGYRYYETRYEDLVMGKGNADSAKGSLAGGNGSAWNYTKEVAFPFGYGLSYTDFIQSDFAVNETADAYEVSVKVTNNGRYDGKEVVQIYLQKPYTDYDKANGIEKASVELIGYAKTQKLAPTEYETVTVSVPKEFLRAYDAYNEGTYILEDGDYYLSAGLNSHDALNNILAAKGYTQADDGMDYDGNAAFAHKITIDVTGEAAYELKNIAATGYEIENRFSDADINLYAGTEGQETTYLSRNDWDATYPTGAVISLEDEDSDAVKQFVADMQYGKKVEANPEDEMPVYNRTTSAYGRLTLMHLKDKDYDDPMWQDLLNQMTLDEQIKMVANGLKAYVGASSVTAPSARGDDGPAGIKVGNPGLGSQMNFPAAAVIAATFSNKLAEEVGKAYGMECFHAGVNIAYAPGANMHRTAGSGRNWEYYSEDPFLSGQTMQWQVKGTQSHGIVVLTKHMILNDQEMFRYGVTVWANEQTIREIYLMPFEMAVRNAAMNGVMTSFNRIGTTYSGAHKGMITDVLRGEWGFMGIVESDSASGISQKSDSGIGGGVQHMTSYNIQAEGFLAGQDIWMLGGNPDFLSAYKSNPTVMLALRESIHRVMYSKLNSNMINGMTTNSVMVYFMTWWEKALIIAEIAVAALLTLCLLMAVLSYVFKIRPVTASLEKAAAGGFFTKTKSAIIIACIAVGLALILLLGTLLPILSKTKDPDTTGLVIREPVSVGQEGICPVCDLPFEDHGEDYCGMDKDPYIYEAEDAEIAGGAGRKTDNNASAGGYIGDLNGKAGATVTFTIVMPEEAIVSLKVTVNQRVEESVFTDNLNTYVNGKQFNSTAKIPANGGEAETWTAFSDFNLGCITLKEGSNTIQFKVSNITNFAYNFDRITILSEVEPPYACDELCPVCGECMSIDPDHPDHGPKCGEEFGDDDRTKFGKAEAMAAGATVTSSGLSDLISWTGGDGGNPKWEGTGNEFIGNVSNNFGATITFVIYAEETGRVNLSAGVTIRGNNVSGVDQTYFFDEGYSIKVNGEALAPRHTYVPSFGNAGNQWTTVVNNGDGVNVGCVDLVAGRNEITFTVVGRKDAASNFHHIIIGSSFGVSFTPFV